MTLPADLRARIEDARRRLEALRAARSAAENAPVDRTTAIARIDAILENALANRANFWEYLSSRQGGFSPTSFASRANTDMLGLLALMAPEAIRAAMVGAIKPGGLSEAERAETLARIDAGTLEIEVAEELDLRYLDETAIHERRRRDANPRVLLAPIAELIAAAQQMKPPAPAAARRSA